MPSNGDQELQLPQGTIRYREYGSGEPIVFVHGLLVNGQLWRKVVPLLAGRYRCLVPDWPLGSHAVPLSAGADYSPPGLARLIADFIAALGLKEVTLVGNDTGGALCQIVVTEHPERIGRLVLTNCDCFENFLPPFFRPLQYGAHIPGFLFLLLQTMRLEAMRNLPMAYGWLAKRRMDRALTYSYIRPALDNHVIQREVGNILKGISPRYTLAAAEKLPRFSRPVLLAWAKEDRFFRFAHAQKLSRLFPNARLEAIADSYTFVPEDQPERLAELIDEFMSEPQKESTQPSQAGAGSLEAPSR